MFGKQAKAWLCIGLVSFWGVAGLQGDVRLEPLQTVKVMAQTAPQECKDAAGATIPCPPADDEDRGRTDCEDADRDGVCDSQEPSGCVGQLDELGNGCAAEDDDPGVNTPRGIGQILRDFSGFSSSYPQPDCNDPDSGIRLLVPAVQKVREAAARSQTNEGCPDPEPVFDCNVNGPFAFCNTFSSDEPEGTEITCTGKSGGDSICCSNIKPECTCTGTVGCSALAKICNVIGGAFEGSKCS